ncbi:MAG: excinuclease ABC subunit UvrB [Phycisphaerae bacterium]|nr:excinuclease ABC subunit UvrB [Phycisphaerae bacterium]
MPDRFELVSAFAPTGDQPAAIEQLVRELGEGKPAACLLGATGTGKTFTMANVIARLNRPTLIISHNKTLAAQLFEELREFFPRNSVNYFVSYYDYYQPEAYIPQRDIYIEKDSSRNDDLDRLRLAATSSILSRRDTVVVASVSCIFGLGSPEAYHQRVLTITVGSPIHRREFLAALSAMQYRRAEVEFARGTFRVRGEAVEVFPAYESFALRIDLSGGLGDEVARIDLFNPTSGEVLAEERQFFLFPAVHHVMPREEIEPILARIRSDLDARVMELRSQGKLLEAQRLLGRTKYDLELIEEVGYCSGIENYSRYFDGRAPGERPFCLLDYFSLAGRHGPLHETAGTNGARGGVSDAASSWLLIIDESHVTIPQLHAMYHGDRNRKQVLVEHGFRLPAALDNRPLRFEEFEAIIPQAMFVSATPGPYELARCGGVVAEQVIRPTGLVDPVIEVRPARGQVPDLIERCQQRVAAGERVLVTALTKRLCEDLSQYLEEQGLRVRYLHSDVETLDRVQILTDLRAGEFDVLVGVNLLREGLDLPEVSLVCILDADKEGFLRSPTSLIQQMGRAARNVNALVVMYADKVTPAMRAAIEETERRRAKQVAYNEAHGITPRTIIKALRSGLQSELAARKTAREAVKTSEPAIDARELERMLEADMLEAAEALEFEKAAAFRDQLSTLRQRFPLAPAGEEAVRVKRSELEAALSGKPAKKRPGMPGVKVRRRGPRGG